MKEKLINMRKKDKKIIDDLLDKLSRATEKIDRIERDVFKLKKPPKVDVYDKVYVNSYDEDNPAVEGMCVDILSIKDDIEGYRYMYRIVLHTKEERWVTEESNIIKA